MKSLKEICIVTANQLESENPARNRILSLINGFLEKEYTVHLISMDRDDYKICTHHNFIHHKIPFVNVKISSFFKRAYLEMKIALNAIRKANQINCEFSLVTIPSMFLLHLSFFLKNNRVKILDIRDLSWEYLSDKSFFQRIAKQIFRMSAHRNLSNFSFIDVTNDHELKYVKSIVPNTPLFKMTNGVSEKIYNQLSSLPKDTKEKDKTVVTYIGNIGLAQDLSTLIKASEELPEIQFNIVGHGTDFYRVSKFVNKDQCNIKFWGQVDFEMLKSVYIETDILYAQLAPEFSGAMPSKLYEYLATGKYIIYGGHNVAVNILNGFDNISIIEAQNVQQLVSTLKKIEEKKLYKIKSLSNQKKIYDEFVRERSVEDFINYIESR
ncbi:glycosyltransferase [Acinetobacter pittii]|uniref:glycosyltransferase n=1 Tax=Acinetobacter pittii TaxID=48296 RepID=UPI001F063B7E|nr:glycosyltransferase [Acinetobacter pittii]MCH2072676.1 glycosyltransferase [Acinetobacter pittii]